MVSEYVLKNEAWDGAQASFSKGYEKGKREAADTIDRLTRELAEARDKACAVVGFPATMTTEAHDGRGTVIIRFDTLKDAYGFVDALVAIRALKEKP